MEHKNKLYRLSGLIGLLLLASCGFSSQPAQNTEGGLTSEAWSPPSTTQLDAGQGFVVDQEVAVEPDGGGTAIAVWIEQADLNPGDSLPAIYHLYARRFSGAWGSSVLIDTGSFEFPAFAPQIAMDDNGDAIVVWQQGDGTASRVYARRFSGGTWAASAEVLDSGGGAASPSIAVEPDGGGTAMADYERFDSTTSRWRVYARRLTGGIGAGAWGAETDIGTGTICCAIMSVDFNDTEGQNLGQWTSIAVDSGGAIHISYYDTRDQTSNQGALRYLTSGSPPVVVDNPAQDVGQYTSIAVDSGGRVHISYYDVNNTNLKYATCISSCASAASWTKITIPDPAASVGQWTGIAVQGSGATLQVHISYYDATNTSLKYATCNGDAGGNGTRCDQAADWPAANIITVDNVTSASTGQYTSIAVDSGGRLHISYQDVSNTNLMYATCSASCTVAGNWTRITIPDPAASVGEWTGIAVEGFGATLRVHISYYDATNTALKYVTCNGDIGGNGTRCDQAADWPAANIVTVDNTAAVGQYTDIAVSSTGVLYISYLDAAANEALRYATCSASCATAANWTFTTVHSGSADNANNDVGKYTSIAVDSDGAAHISYFGTWRARDKLDPLSGVLYATLMVGKQAYGPQVAMDNSGHAMATFIQFVQGVCYGIQTRNNDQTDTDFSGPDVSVNLQIILPLPPAGCGDDRLWANRFEASTASWQSPGPRDLTPPVTLASGRADCFNQNMDGFNGRGLGIDPRVNVFSDACVDVSEVNLVMDRNGVAFVAFKSFEFNQAEETFDTGGTDERNPGEDCRNPGALCDTNTTFNHQEIHINARRFSSGSGGAWSPNKLLARWYFEARRPEDNPAGAPIIAQNCGTLDNFTNAQDTDNLGSRILNCDFSGLSLSVEPDGGGTAFITAERYSSTTASAANAVSDIVAFRFDGTRWNRWTGAAFSRVEYGGASTNSGNNNLDDNTASWTVNEWAGGLLFIASGTGAGQLKPVSSNNATQLTTATDWFIAPPNGSTYQISSGYDPDTLGPIDTGSLDAFAPRVAMDNAGNSVAAWTQKDGTGKWRIYSRCYANSLAPDTCTEGATGWRTLQIIDGNVNGHDHYFNPTLGMAHPGGAGTSAWVLFDGFTLSTVTNRLYGTRGP